MSVSTVELNEIEHTTIICLYLRVYQKSEKKKNIYIYMVLIEVMLLHLEVEKRTGKFKTELDRERRWW